jgi:hypothetical protein
MNFNLELLVLNDKLEFVYLRDHTQHFIMTQKYCSIQRSQYHSASFGLSAN